MRIIPSAENYCNTGAFNNLRIVRYRNSASKANEYVVYPSMANMNAKGMEEVLTEIGNEKGERYPLRKAIFCNMGPKPSQTDMEFNSYLSRLFNEKCIQSYKDFSQLNAYEIEFDHCGTKCTEMINNGRAIWMNMEGRFQGQNGSARGTIITD